MHHMQVTLRTQIIKHKQNNTTFCMHVHMLTKYQLPKLDVYCGIPNVYAAGSYIYG